MDLMERLLMSATRNGAPPGALFFHNAALQRENAMWFYVLDLVSCVHWAFWGKSSERRSRGVVPTAERCEDRCVPCATGLGADPILMSAIPVEQVSQARIMGDGATYKPTESLSIQESVR